jgi:hypothetical protein
MAGYACRCSVQMIRSYLALSDLLFSVNELLGGKKFYYDCVLRRKPFATGFSNRLTDSQFDLKNNLNRKDVDSVQTLRDDKSVLQTS